MKNQEFALPPFAPGTGPNQQQRADLKGQTEFLLGLIQAYACANTSVSLPKGLRKGEGRTMILSPLHTSQESQAGAKRLGWGTHAAPGHPKVILPMSGMMDQSLHLVILL